jgi:hypothetical protein
MTTKEHRPGPQRRCHHGLLYSAERCCTSWAIISESDRVVVLLFLGDGGLSYRTVLYRLCLLPGTWSSTAPGLRTQKTVQNREALSRWRALHGISLRWTVNGVQSVAQCYPLL